MKIVTALALFLAVAQASLIPRKIELPLFASDDGAGAMRVSYVDEKIVGGSEAVSGQFPWQVSITIDSAYFCGGSIISNTWVLTAGDCVDGFFSFRLVFGSTTPNGGASGTVAHTSRETILHSSYNANTLANNIAVIELPTALIWSSLINSIRLPSRSQEGNNFVGRKVRTSGWGLTSDSSSGISPLLRWADLIVITNNECAATFGTAIRASHICTSGSGGTCNGDIGGPLVLQESDGLFTQIGVVSFGFTAGCSQAHLSVFTRVTSYLSWIESSTGITILP